MVQCIVEMDDRTLFAAVTAGHKLWHEAMDAERIARDALRKAQGEVSEAELRRFLAEMLCKPIEEEWEKRQAAKWESDKGLLLAAAKEGKTEPPECGWGAGRRGLKLLEKFGRAGVHELMTELRTMAPHWFADEEEAAAPASEG